MQQLLSSDSVLLAGVRDTECPHSPAHAEDEYLEAQTEVRVGDGRISDREKHHGEDEPGAESGPPADRPGGTVLLVDNVRVPKREPSQNDVTADDAGGQEWFARPDDVTERADESTDDGGDDPRECALHTCRFAAATKTVFYTRSTVYITFEVFRFLLALAASGLAAAAGCSGQSNNGSDPATDTPTATPTETPEPETVDVVTVDALQPGVIELNTPDSIGVNGLNTQYVFLDVTGGNAPPARSELAFVLDGTAHASMEEIRGVCRVYNAGEDERYSPASPGWVLFELPATADDPDSARLVLSAITSWRARA